MKLKLGTEEAYEKYKLANPDPYGARVVSYGEDWANLMEKRMVEGATIAECADATSREADYDGITGFMYGCAVSALDRFWEHGDELRRWHNRKTQIGTEGDKANETGGTLNPALLVIGS